MSGAGSLRRSVLIRRLAFATALLVLGAVVAVFVGYRRMAPNPETLVRALPEKATITMGRITHTATRDGRTEWQLTAESARLLEGQKRLELEAPQVVYFTKDGHKIHLKAEQGRLDTATNDMTAKGRVRAEDGKYRLESERLHYDHRRQRVTCPVPVRIFDARTEATADSLVYDMNRRRLELKGHVDVHIDRKRLI